MIYKPKARRKGVKVPFGYFINPLDPQVCIPDPKKLDALHYAFSMRAKYGTPYRDCVVWLHSATGNRMTAHGFMYIYKTWSSKLKKEKAKEIKAKKEAIIHANQVYIDKNYKELEYVVNDEHNITAMAEKAVQEASKKANSQAK